MTARSLREHDSLQDIFYRNYLSIVALYIYLFFIFFMNKLFFLCTLLTKTFFMEIVLEMAPGKS